MALAKKDNMKEHRWKIKYPDARKNEAGPWIVGKRAAMKDFSNFMCRFKSCFHFDQGLERDRLRGQESTQSPQ